MQQRCRLATSTGLELVHDSQTLAMNILLRPRQHRDDDDATCKMLSETGLGSLRG